MTNGVNRDLVLLRVGYIKCKRYIENHFKVLAYSKERYTGFSLGVHIAVEYWFVCKL